MNQAVRVACVLGLTFTIQVSPVLAWSGGPLLNATDLDAKCAVCHSSVSREQLRLDPPGLATAWSIEGRHYKPLEDGTGPYQSMSPADRQKLLADVKTVDQGASVTLDAPQSVRPGQEIQVTTTVRGGNEVVAVALVDSDLRNQGRPIQGDGWIIVGAPKIWGSDNAEQTKWIERRGKDLRKNINSAVIFDRKADLAAKQFAGGRATWTVRAPQEPGTYSMTALMFYGTEKASAVGGVATPTGAMNPRGGAFGPSGRMMFAKPVTITVR
jgi:hypothetical protein